MRIKKKILLLGTALIFGCGMQGLFAQNEQAHDRWMSLVAQTETDLFFRAYTEEKQDQNTFVSFDLMPDWCDHFEMSVNLRDPSMASKAYNDDIFLGDLQVDSHEAQTMTFQLSIDPEYTLLHFIPTNWNRSGNLLDELLQGKNLTVHLNDKQMQFSLTGAKEALTRIVGLCTSAESPQDDHLQDFDEDENDKVSEEYL